MHGSMFRFRRVSNQAGSLDIFIAAAMVLPLLLLTLFGGWTAIQIAVLSTELQGAQEVGAEAAAIQGGVTSQVQQDVRSALTGTSLQDQAQEISVTGTPPPVPWGETVALYVSLPLQLEGFPWTVLGLEGKTVVLGGKSDVSSNLVPAGP